jgi:tRNA (guanine37-N1)-methyltransferase
MQVTIVTIFPEMFPGPLGHSLLAKAQASGLLKLETVDLRRYTSDRHRTVDDTPFGGGGGMVMKPEPFFEAVEDLRGPGTVVVMPGPAGRRLDQALVLELSRAQHLLFLCGHYEGVDQRVHERLVDVEVSLGDYVLSGGELAAMVLVDAVARHIPGVVGDFRSVERDSFYDVVLDHPHYTRPREYRGWEVPEVLLSGDHASIARWRRREALRLTRARRPDLLEAATLSSEDRRLLAEIEQAERVAIG